MLVRIAVDAGNLLHATLRKPAAPGHRFKGIKRYPPIERSDRFLGMPHVKHSGEPLLSYADSCSSAFRSTPTLFSNASASAAVISGTNVSSTPCLPTTLGSESVTPNRSI